MSHSENFYIYLLHWCFKWTKCYDSFTLSILVIQFSYALVWQCCSCSCIKNHHDKKRGLLLLFTLRFFLL
jgi:hypothetical protein